MVIHCAMVLTWLKNNKNFHLDPHFSCTLWLWVTKGCSLSLQTACERLSWSLGYPSANTCTQATKFTLTLPPTLTPPSWLVSKNFKYEPPHVARRDLLWSCWKVLWVLCHFKEAYAHQTVVCYLCSFVELTARKINTAHLVFKALLFRSMEQIRDGSWNAKGCWF